MYLIPYYSCDFFCRVWHDDGGAYGDAITFTLRNWNDGNGWIVDDSIIAFTIIIIIIIIIQHCDYEYGYSLSKTTHSWYS